MSSTEKILLNFLHHVMQNPEDAAQEEEDLPEDLRAFGDELRAYCLHVHETMLLAKALSQGDLDVPLPPPDNKMAAPLKNLHATLKHLTWQTQRVAQRDYQQRVDFMGEFSQAFNTMTEQLQLQYAALLREIENRQRQITALSQNKSLYELLVGEIQQWIIVADADTGEYLFISREVGDALLEPDAEMQMRRWMQRQMQEAGGTGMHTADLELTTNGGVYYYSVSIHPLYWLDRRAFAFVLTDVSREREQMNNLQTIANYDTLTQTYNRGYGMSTLNELLMHRSEFVLAFVDINNLKYVNDCYGHTEGDRYIMLVANVLRDFSAQATICRIGGDEFMVLAEDVDVPAAIKRLDEMQQRLKDEPCAPGMFYEHSMSYGLVDVNENNTLKATELLSIADERMYDFKRAYKRRHSRR